MEPHTQEAEARQASPTTNPTELIRRRDGLYASDLLVTAIGWLDFFHWLAEHPADLETICASLHIAPRPTDVMLTLFTAMGLLKVENNVYRLTPLSKEFLTESSLCDLRPYFSSMKGRSVCLDILEVLRTDKPFAWPSIKNIEDWMIAMGVKEFAETFTAGMDGRGAYLAPIMAQRLDCTNHRKFLDIAGGSGVYACGVVSQHPHMQAAVLEQPPVDEVARAAIAKRGLLDRVSVIASDMFADPFPVNFDIHFYSHVLHDWNEATAQTLLRKSFEALPPGGLVVIHDGHLYADKTGPLEVAEFSVLLMLTTAGRCYSLGELQDMLENIGFVDVQYVPTDVYRSLIMARKVA